MTPTRTEQDALDALAAYTLTHGDIADLCAEFEKAVADSVADRVRRAMEIAAERLPESARHLVVAGGVAANKALRGAFVTCKRMATTWGSL